MRKYLHDYEHHLEREQVLLKESDIPVSNKKVIGEFRNYDVVNSISTPRILRSVSILRLVSQKIQKPFEKWTAKDVETFLVWMNTEGFAVNSIATYRATLKVFFKWLNKGSYPDCVSWIKSTGKSKSKKLPEDLLTQEEVKLILQAATTERDKALIATLWESGGRVGEIGGMQLKNVQFDDFGCQIMVDGKTGMRRVRLVTAAPYLLGWINNHPTNQNPNAPLWVTLHRNCGQQLVYQHIKKIVDWAGKRAGIKKPLNPHNFRHSRATYMAQFLTEAQMKEYFGWTQDSDMAARYVHLSGKQVDDAILKMYGLKKQEQRPEILKQEPCPRCKTLNGVSHQYCEKCWLPLTAQAANELSETQQKDQQAMAAVMKLIELAKANPQVIQQALSQITKT